MSEVEGIAKEQLQKFIERIERLEDEKQALQADIKDVYAQAKSQGFDTKAMRQIIKLRKLDEQEREEAEQIIDLYKVALGMA